MLKVLLTFSRGCTLTLTTLLMPTTHSAPPAPPRPRPSLLWECTGLLTVGKDKVLTRHPIDGVSLEALACCWDDEGLRGFWERVREEGSKGKVLLLPSVGMSPVNFFTTQNSTSHGSERERVD